MEDQVDPQVAAGDAVFEVIPDFEISNAARDSDFLNALTAALEFESGLSGGAHDGFGSYWQRCGNVSW